MIVSFSFPGREFAGAILAICTPNATRTGGTEDSDEDEVVMALAMVTVVAASAMAQTAATTNMDILRQKIKADRKLVVAQNLQLTDTEGAAFWPVYDAYQKDLQQINQRMTTVIFSHRPSAFALW